MKTNIRSFFLLRWGLTCILFLTLESHAWAHALLDHAEPKVGSTVTDPPAEVKIWFTQDLEPAFSTIEVTNAQGREVDKKDSHVDSKNKSLLIVSLGKLPAGAYTVAWHVVSVDTHKTQGHFAFYIK